MVTGANPELVHDSPRDGRSPWHDTGYVLEGDVARAAISAFEQTWNTDADHWDCRTQSHSRDCDKRDTKFPSPQRDWLSNNPYQPGNIPVLAVGRKKGWTVPPNNDTNNPQDVAWLTVMDSAKMHIHVESPNINDDAFRAAVVRAVGRGVTVRLIASLGFNFGAANAPFQGSDNQEVVGDLRQEIRRKHPTELEKFQVRWFSRDGVEPIQGNGSGASHTKYMSVDDQVVIVGSGNMETPAWNFSHEFNILIDDRQVTKRLEDAIFQVDWQSSVGNYLELYEGNAGWQDVVCPISVNRNKSLRFSSTRFCDNDEIRSILLHNVPAGKVLRFYDNPDWQYQDDDWTEIIVKRQVPRKYINSYERSFEDSVVQVMAHHDNGLDGKVSAAEVSTRPVGPVVDLYEGNNGKQNLVCSIRASQNRTIDFIRDPHCDNDEVRSLKLYNFPADKVVFVYDDSGGNREDDWAAIVTRRRISEATVASFERSVQNSDWAIWNFRNNGLDGKVSRLRIGDKNELQPVVSFYEGANASQNKVCDINLCEVAVNFKRHRLCDNDEARSLALSFAAPGTVIEVFDSPDRRRNDDWTRIRVKREIGRKVVGTFERSFSDNDVDVTYHRKNGLNGKVSSVRILVP